MVACCATSTGAGSGTLGACGGTIAGRLVGMSNCWPIGGGSVLRAVERWLGDAVPGVPVVPPGVPDVSSDVVNRLALGLVMYENVEE